MSKNLKIFTDNIEQKAIDQINELLEQEPFKNCKVRIMPDVHAGKGCVIGFTANLGDKVIPNLVGVDIGCGMSCVNVGKTKINLERFDKIVKRRVPSGRNIHEQKIAEFKKINELYCLRELKESRKFNRALGTLGGGNHFIELDKDEEDNIYLVVHTGSRNLGKQVAEYYQNLAVELCSGKEDMFKEKERIIKEYKEQGKKSEIQSAIQELYKKYKNNTSNLPKDLCYLTGKYRDMYLHDMAICQEYASFNRMIIINEILIYYLKSCNNDKPLYIRNENTFETVHNYICFEDNIIRKGAIRANKGEKVIIPINMRDGSIIAIGKGNEDWNNSAPHGAGRIMSRMKAKETLNMKEFEETMKDIYSTSVTENTLDEAPFAYKSMQEIIDNIQDTVEIIKIIKPIYNFKAQD